MDFIADIEPCLEVLRTGGIILYPTDTIWGIGCDATDANAVKKIFDLKQRPGEKTLIVLLADQRDLLRYVSQPDPAIFDFLNKTQRPTTVIYEGAIGLADNLIATDGTVAIRLVNDPFCKHLIKRFRKPLVSTSANISADPAPRFFDEIPEKIIKGVDYAVHYRRGDKIPRQASSIVKYNKDGTVTVIR
jgi:L-threonylcarbamoyladenylate synthase